ncbi:TPA: hypothetical protein HA235_00705 [Candidatus Woesearchaeota archaeon]|nr:hypothetical protein [Candidatus Woesearchaeota archaeon]HIH31204.1 hypothetical protein [Candidatus Woesearchaeota archaeon]HIH55530.1 hypothetical protein [Candidatus Woesearchaeota archaeon]HIJ01850.1 hypothetical protein [Candidatus Woesearchaeota archaeon]HIJ13143.1 hypothetical protein [Candidatus Woesearchaeota archaeon]
MVEVSVNTEKPFEIIPDVKKETLKTGFFIGVIFLISIAIVIFLQIQVGLGFLIDVFAVFGTEITGGQIALTIIALFLIFAIAVLAFSYLSIKNVKYSVFKDKIMHKETQALVLMLNQEVPFKNITRITFSRSGFLNKLLDCGDITIDLTALNIKEVKLLSINNPEQVAQYLQGMLNNYNATQQMQFQEQKKIEGIMERF